MTVRAAVVSALTAARLAVADRGALGVAAGFYVVVLVAVSSLWRAAADANGGTVAGYTASELTWYIAASEAAVIAVRLRLLELVADDIADGTVAVEMLRPASVVGVRLASEVGRTLPRVAVCGVAGAVAATALTGGPPGGRALLLAAPALVLATGANVIGQHVLGAIAFWLRDIRALWILYQKLVFILGGMLIPLELLPDGIQTVARALPFMALAYVPARLASGRVEPALVGVQLAWIAVLGAVAVATFAAGERRLQVVGG